MEPGLAAQHTTMGTVAAMRLLYPPLEWRSGGKGGDPCTPANRKTGKREARLFWETKG